MTTDQKLIRNKLGLLDLASYLKNGGCQIFSVNGNHQLAVTLSPNRIRN